jgi:superfamily II DNA or RNA helicase
MSALLLGDDKNTLIVVDSKTLMYQLAENIKTFTGIECGIVGDSNFYPKKWTVAVIDSLLSQRGEGLIRNTEALYFDEAHKAGAPTYRSVVDVGKDNVVIRRGFSGTAFRNDNRTYLLPALTGPVVVHYTTSQMIDDGWLAIPNIIMPSIANFQSRATYYPQIYRSCIINNTYRNKICVEAMVGPAKKGYSVVGFFRNVREHLPAIRNLLYSAFPKAQVGVLHGTVLSINRRRVLSEFASGDKRILLASVGTTGEGIDLPGETKVGVNFAGGCSEIAIRQLLGRCLRKPKLKGNEIDKSKPFHIYWVDPFDFTNQEMKRQSDIRHDIYAGEPSFIMEEED